MTKPSTIRLRPLADRPGGRLDPARIWSSDDLVAVYKPSGWATHAPDPDGEGIVEWLAEELGESLGVHHRLDAATSGVLVFSRSAAGSALLARNFERRLAKKTYRAVACGELPPDATVLRDRLSPRRGERVRVLDEPRDGDGGRAAVTRVRPLAELGPFRLYELEPVTGRTHQIRVQLASRRAPVLGDQVYGGGCGAGEMQLHAAALELDLADDGRLQFVAAHPAPWMHPEASETRPAPHGASAMDEGHADQGSGQSPGHRIGRGLRPGLDHPHGRLLGHLIDACVAALVAPYRDEPTVRLGTPDDHGLPALKLDRYGAYVVIRRYETDPPAGWSVPALRHLAEALRAELDATGVYVKTHAAHGPGRTALPPIHPDLAESGASDGERPIVGDTAPEVYTVVEDGVCYEASMTDGLGCRLYLDQRANRAWVRRLAGGRRVLNLFAYTCTFSVAAAVGGARETTSVDVSRKALAIGRRNFELNGLDATSHRFFDDDAITALERAERRGDRFGIVICDPPSFARRGRKTFSIERDLEALVSACVAVTESDGWLLLCVNYRGLRLTDLRSALEAAATAQDRDVRDLQLEVTEDGHTPLGVGTDLKTLRARLR